MLSPRGGRCLRQLTTQPSPVGCLPAFLLPAFSSTPTVRPFSTSIPCASRVGGATLSLPPEVNMTILAPPTPMNKKRISRVEPVATVEVEGPLGTNQCTGSAVASNDLRRQDVDAAATLHGHRAQRCSQESIVEGPGPRDKAAAGDVGCLNINLHHARDVTANINQARPVPTSRITSSASQKAIPPFCDWSVLGTEPQLSQVPSPCRPNTPVNSLFRSRLDIHIPSSWVCRRASRLVRHNRLVYCWKEWTRRS